MKSKFLLALSFFILTFTLSPVSATDAIIAYRSNTGTYGLNSPKIRFWNSSNAGSWGSEIELPTAGSPIREVIVKYSPVSEKIVLVTQSDDGYLDAYVCTSNCNNTNSWIITNNIGQVWSTAPTPHSRRFDIEFETKTGDLLVVYGVLNTSVNCDLAYKILPATSTSFSESVEYCIDDDSANGGSDLQYSWVKLDRKPVSNSEEIILVGFDSSGSDVNAWVWNGNTWGNRVELTDAATATGGYEAIAVKYASDGSKGMVISATGTIGAVVGRYWDGSTWTVADIGDLDAGDNQDTRWLTLKADPASDDLMAVSINSGSDLDTMYWNGSSWTITANIDGTVDLATARCADFAWNPSGSTGRLVWDTDTTGTTLSQRTCSPLCTSSTTTFSSYAGTGAWISLYTNPTDSDTINIIGARLNSNFDIGSFSFDGTNYVNYGDSIITADTTVSTFEAYSISFHPPVGYLNVTLISPTGTNNYAQNQTFVLIANVTCAGPQGAVCGKVNGTLRYNTSNSNPDTNVQGNGVYAIPFYTIESNPQECGNLNLNSPPCSLKWTVNVTGNVGSSYKLDVNFVSDSPYVQSNKTDYTTVNIVEEFLSVTLSNYPICFGSVTGTGIEINASDGSKTECGTGIQGFPMNVYIESNVNTSIWLRGDTDLIGSASSISVNNLKCANNSNPASKMNLLLNQFILFQQNIQSGSIIPIYWWLFVPAGQVADVYTGNITILVNKTS
ncbi:MAG: hypothetical protein QXP04_04780 [Candidatus Nanoarchaeia archaeon]|nr:hypothetical protein [Candidatus Jingweiarchaeum tengchongense]MCW1309978.1 hypothetical protein [Candidatus Jingweiarchaeum tengchongense]